MSLEILANSSIFYNNRLIPNSGPFSLFIRCDFNNLAFNTPSGTYYLFKLTSSLTGETLRFGVKYDKNTGNLSTVLNYSSLSQSFTFEISFNNSLIGNCIIIERTSANILKFWTESPSITSKSTALSIDAFNNFDQVWISGNNYFSFKIFDFTIWSTEGYNNTIITDLLNLHPLHYKNLSPILFHHTFFKSQNNPYIISPVEPVYTNINFTNVIFERSPYETTFSYNFGNNRSVTPPTPTEYVINLISTLGFNTNGSGQNVQVPPYILENIIKISQSITTGGTLATYVWEDFLTFIHNIKTTIIEEPSNYIYMVEQWLLEREVLEPGSTEEIIRIVEQISRVIDVNKSIYNQVTFHNDAQLIKQSTAQDFGV